MNYFYEIYRINDKTIEIRVTNLIAESVFKKYYIFINCENSILNLHPLDNLISCIKITNTLIINMINHNMHLSLRDSFTELVIEDIMNKNAEVLLS